MTPSTEFLEWLLSAVADTEFPNIAVDDGGLAVVTCDDDGNIGPAYFEIGGVPLPEDE